MLADIAIVTGGRDYALTQADYAWLGKMLNKYKFRLVLHGDARGVDRAIAAWVQEIELCAAACPAQWKKFGNSAGPKRNSVMAWACEKMQAVCLAFPGGAGTASMVAYAKAYKIPVEESPSRKEN